MKPTRQATIEQIFARLERQKTKPVQNISSQPPTSEQVQAHQQLRLNKQPQKDNTKIPQEKNVKKGGTVDLDISGSQSEPAIQTEPKKKQVECKIKDVSRMNVEFYLNKMASEPNGDHIDNIHKKWWGNYEKLEEHHGFIQWLFPNAFQSRFNRMASPMSLQQAKQFQENIEIAKRYQTSYIMMLQFYGMKLKCKTTGEIARSRHPMHQDKVVHVSKPFFEERFNKTFLTSFHNHMRITRMLSSLVMCGFGRYARQLSIFLKKEIEDGALRGLMKYGVYERQWQQYTQYIEKQDEKNILLKQYEKSGKL